MWDCFGLVAYTLQSVETVDKRNGSVFSNLRFNMFSDGSRSQDAKILTFCPAILVGLDSSNEKIISSY